MPIERLPLVPLQLQVIRNHPHVLMDRVPLVRVPTVFRVVRDQHYETRYPLVRIRTKTDP